MAQKRTFARGAPGFARGIGSFGAIGTGISSIGVAAPALVAFSWIPWMWPGSDLVAVLAISMVLGLLHATTYSQIGAIYARSGGDYVVGSRIISPMIQFGTSYMFTFLTSMVAGMFLAWIPSSVLSSFLWSWGVVFNYSPMLLWADWIVTPTGILLVGLALVVVTYVLSLMPSRAFVGILLSGTILGLLAWVLTDISYLMVPGHQAFVDAWNRFAPVRYENVILLAQQNGFTQGAAPWWLLTGAAMIMGFWVFFGHYTPSFFGGEFKEPSKALIIGMWGSLIVTGVVFTIAALLLYPRLMSMEWMAAEGFLYYNTHLWALPFPTFYATILWPHPIPMLIIMFGFVLNLITLAMAYFYSNSRVFFAMAFDRALPTNIAYVNPRLRSPIVAMTLCAAVAAFGVYASQFIFIFTQYNLALYAAVVQLVPVAAAIIYPFVSREEFARAPRLVSFRLGPVPGITIIGIGTLAYLIWLIVSVVVVPPVGGFLGWWTPVGILLFFLVGTLIFAIARWYRLRKEGLDINAAYREIPPI